MNAPLEASNALSSDEVAILVHSVKKPRPDPLQDMQCIFSSRTSSLKQERTDLPGFHYGVIDAVVSSVKDQLYRHLLSVLRVYARIADSATNFENEQDLWLLSLLCKKYGVIYFISRREVFASRRRVSKQKRRLREIDELLLPSITNLLFNIAVHSTVRSRYRFLRHARIRLPSFYIGFESQDSWYVNRFDVGEGALKRICEPVCLYDLHDFCHLACATINSELYGSKYFDTFQSLPRPFHSLIRDKELRSSRANRLSDGVIFSELSLRLFDQLNERLNSDREIVDRMALRLSDYLLARTSLVHPSTETEFSVERPIDPLDLAVLSQNKAYERPASEIEEYVLVRGGPTDREDPLHGQSTSEFYETLLGNKRLLYFERRNYLRHRAQTKAYQVCAHILENQERRADMRQLLLNTRRNLSFEDFKSRSRRNLFGDVHELLCRRYGVVHRGYKQRSILNGGEPWSQM